MNSLLHVEILTQRECKKEKAPNFYIKGFAIRSSNKSQELNYTTSQSVELHIYYIIRYFKNICSVSDLKIVIYLSYASHILEQMCANGTSSYILIYLHAS